MRATVKLMSMDLMDRLLAHPGPSPEESAMQTEDTEENQQAEALADEWNAREEKIRRLLDREYALLEPHERVALAVYLEHEGCARDFLADRLEVKSGTLRTAIWRARGKKRSGDRHSASEKEPRCVHGPGKDLWDAIAMKVALKLKDGEEKHHDE
ncbi:MAG: hypothetical protein LAO55_17365 [Acidobacteriia bacterium]|nr:hypothetical protein [Terriglobia bacterium]